MLGPFRPPRHPLLMMRFGWVAARSARSLARGHFRGDLARAVVESGWDLNELRPAAMSLEEVFLQLTGSEASGEEAKETAKESQQ